MRRLSFPLFSWVLAVCLSTVTSNSFGTEFTKLIRRVPESANALVLVNADKLYMSPVAVSEEWEKNREERYNAGLTVVPPSADKMVIASQLDLEYMHPTWQFALVESEKPTLLATVARKFGGVLDKVVGMPAVRLPDDSFIVELSETLRGAMAPANRQQTSRWVGLADHNLSPYLQDAANFADNAGHVILALDVTHSITAEDVAHRLGSNMDVYGDILQKSPVEPKELAELLASMKGVMLGITFQDQAYGKIRIDFGVDATKLEPIAKPLLLAILHHRGAMIEDFDDWVLAVDGMTITLGGKLSSSGVMRLSSLIELPTHVLATDETANAANGEGAQDNTPPTMVEATQAYFKSTEDILKDLRRHKGQGKSIGTYGMWFENYARKVERLPMLNVDEEMLNYGSFLSTQLRNASMAIKGIGIRSRPEAMAAASNAGGGSINFSSGFAGGYRGYGGYRNLSSSGTGTTYLAARAAGDSPGMAAFAASKDKMRQQQQARVQVRANEKAKGAAEAQQIMGQIQAGQAQIRRNMVEKYKVEF